MRDRDDPQHPVNVVVGALICLAVLVAIIRLAVILLAGEPWSWL